jgi:hypothetical protein
MGELTSLLIEVLTSQLYSRNAAFSQFDADQRARDFRGKY